MRSARNGTAPLFWGGIAKVVVESEGTGPPEAPPVAACDRSEKRQRTGAHQNARATTGPPLRRASDLECASPLVPSHRGAVAFRRLCHRPGGELAIPPKHTTMAISKNGITPGRFDFLTGSTSCSSFARQKWRLPTGSSLKDNFITLCFDVGRLASCGPHGA